MEARRVDWHEYKQQHAQEQERTHSQHNLHEEAAGKIFQELAPRLHDIKQLALVAVLDHDKHRLGILRRFDDARHVRVPRVGEKLLVGRLRHRILRMALP